MDAARGGALRRASYLSLTTFRRDGRPVATPVWFAVDGDRILVWSGAEEGKVKRIRNDPRVRIAVCNFKGELRGPAFDATATVLPDDAAAEVHRLQNRKYWYVKPPYQVLMRILRLLTRGRSQGTAYIEVRLAASAATPSSS